MRHSRAKHCVIAITRQAGCLYMTFTDDGQRGAQPVSNHVGNGLRESVERLSALHVTCEAGPDGDRGFRLAISVPLSPEQALRTAARRSTQAKGAIS